VSNLPDLRALSMPDTQFSAYCKTCWHPVYAMWVDGDHGGACPNGHEKACDCDEARRRDTNSARLAKAMAGSGSEVVAPDIEADHDWDAPERAWGGDLPPSA
jgi:hypothetical protein